MITEVQKENCLLQIVISIKACFHRIPVLWYNTGLKIKIEPKVNSVFFKIFLE